MIRDRFKVIIYMIFGYIGVSIGVVLTLGATLEVQITVALFTVLIGVFGHFTKSEAGYYASIGFNSIGIGALFSAMFAYINIEPSIQSILMTTAISLLIFVVLVYISCIGARKGSFYLLGIAATVVGYIIVINVMSTYQDDVTYLLFIFYHVGFILMGAMWIAGNFTEDIIKYCSIATFSIFVLAAIVLLLFVLAQASGSSSKSKSKSGGLSFLGKRSNVRRSRLGIVRPFGYRRYGSAYWLYSDPYYYYGRRHRGYYNNSNNNTSEKEDDLKRKEEELNEREKALNERENSDLMPKQYSSN